MIADFDKNQTVDIKVEETIFVEFLAETVAEVFAKTVIEAYHLYIVPSIDLLCLMRSNNRFIF